MQKNSKKSRLNDPEHQKLPSLRISHIVYGRELRGNRVFYLVDPKGGGTDKKVAESVVLHRWRRRVFVGFTFSGSRLGPNFWRTLPVVFGDNPKQWQRLSIQDIEDTIEAHRVNLRAGYATLPGANVLHALFEVCGASRLKQLIVRHNDPARQDRFGTPDMFFMQLRTVLARPLLLGL
jgi:hypothetical protein